MLLREAAKGVVTSGSGTYNIGFAGADETQFDAVGMKDLQECWEGFCKEEQIPPDCVDYVEKVQ